jgi:hypothetical protein
MIKMFWFGKYRIKLALCNLAQSSTSQISCRIVFSQHPPNTCHLLVHHCTDPHSCGCIFKCAGYSEEEWFDRISSLHSNMSACGAWWTWRLTTTLFSAVYVLVELCYLS